MTQSDPDPDWEGGGTCTLDLVTGWVNGSSIQHRDGRVDYRSETTTFPSPSTIRVQVNVDAVELRVSVTARASR